MSVLVSGFYLIGVYCGWIVIAPGSLTKIIFSSHRMYEIYALFVHQIPANILALATVRYGLFIFCVLVLNHLFRLYEQGIFFSARNVNCIRFIGYYLIIDWVVIYQLEALASNGFIGFTEPFCGFLIIFIAWVMDEGRKIQKEQELTV